MFWTVLGSDFQAHCNKLCSLPALTSVWLLLTRNVNSVSSIVSGSRTILGSSVGAELVCIHKAIALVPGLSSTVRSECVFGDGGVDQTPLDLISAQHSIL